MTSFAVRSFGCRVNQAEAFGWVEELRRGGLRLEEDSGRGDYLLVNSCTLTKHADRDVRRFIRRAARENPNARIVVTGCLSGRAPEELRRMPGVWLVVPNRGKGGLTAGVLEAAGALGSEAAETSATAGAVEAADTIPYRARAFLKVQDGCDFHCAYCVIPGVRGKSASVAGDDVVGRVRALVEDGYREIVLAGIHLSSYGHDLEPTLAPRAPRARRGGRRIGAGPPKLARPAVPGRAARGAHRGEPAYRAALPFVAPERLGNDLARDGPGVERRIL